jgi:hypothetical protein
MPPALTNSTLAPDLSAGFDSDWSKAQDNYKTAINSGFSEEDADRTYLAPVKAKYEIIRSSPLLLQNRSALTQFNKDFDGGTQDYQKLYNTYSRDGGDWAASQTIKPLLDKWTLKASLPTATVPRTASQISAWYANNPAMQQEQDEAQKQISSGMNPSEVLAAHPMLLKAAPYRQQFEPMYRSAVLQNDRSKAAADERATPSLSNLDAAAKALTSTIADASNGDAVIADAKQKLSRLNQARDAMIAPLLDRVQGQTLQPSQPAPDATAAPPVPTAELPVIQYQKGVAPIKGRIYTIGTDKHNYLWDGTKFVAQ